MFNNRFSEKIDIAILFFYSSSTPAGHKVWKGVNWCWVTLGRYAQIFRLLLITYFFFVAIVHFLFGVFFSLFGLSLSIVCTIFVRLFFGFIFAFLFLFVFFHFFIIYF